MDRLVFRAYAGLAFLAAAIATLLFASAGTLAYGKGWAFWALFVGAALAITMYLARADPSLLERRVAAGPAAERRIFQRAVQSLASIGFLALLVLPGLDYRWGWSHVPLALVALGDALVVASFALIFRVFRANTFTSGTIEVARDQTVVTTGPYGVVRHPMYSGGLLLFVATPLALGSWWGLLVVLPMTAVIVARLLDEERLLRESLPGYTAYCRRLRWRLLPGVW
jgi:protein-S-isoprenylcysteine O-methyltransferase Ste14